MLRIDVFDEKLNKQLTVQAIAKVLGPRELDVFKLLAHGLHTKQIAAELNINWKTVVTHRLRLRKKLNISNVAVISILSWRLRHHIDAAIAAKPRRTHIVRVPSIYA